MLIQLRSLAVHHLIELGDSMPAAVAIGEPLTAELERLLGPGHPDTIRAQNDLALAYREAGRAAEAVPLVERALAAEEQLLGAGHPSTLASRNNLGSVYRATGRPAEAIPLFEQNVAACEALLGADHPKTWPHGTAWNSRARNQRKPRPAPGRRPRRLVDQVGGDFQHDGP